MLFFFGVMARCIGLPLIIATLPSSKNISETIQSRSDRGSLTGRTALEGKIVHIPDALDDPEYTMAEAYAA